MEVGILLLSAYDGGSGHWYRVCVAHSCVRGPTCSGKSTLASDLQAILMPRAGEASTIVSVDVLHQDDFCPPSEQIPWNQVWQVQDWDTPHGSVRMNDLP
mgnify:FL=1